MKFVISLCLLVSLVACSTVAGVGKDLENASEWTKDKMNGTKL